jgi:glutaredoxin
MCRRCLSSGYHRRVNVRSLMRATIFTRPDCPYCAAAKRALDVAGEAYDEVDVLASDEAHRRLLELTGGADVVPVLVEADGEIRIGFGGGV